MFADARHALHPDELAPISDNQVQSLSETDHRPRKHLQKIERREKKSCVARTLRYMTILVFIVFVAWFLGLSWSAGPVNTRRALRVYTLPIPEPEDELEMADFPTCLDGSPPAYYYSPASTNRGLHNWLIGLESQEICNSADDCLRVSQSDQGSSLNMPPSLSDTGVFARDPVKNPTFFDAHHVFIKSCDGGAFLGHATFSTRSGETLTSKGADILRVVIADLTIRHALHSAQSVVFAACGSSGSSLILQADQLRHLMPPSVNYFRILVSSVFFGQVTNIGGTNVVNEALQNAWSLHNMAATTNTSCTKRPHPSTCLLANYSLPFVGTPVFAVESIYDPFQLGCVLLAKDDTSSCHALPGWESCSSNTAPLGPGCSEQQVTDLNRLAVGVINSVRSGVLASAKRNGAAIHDCPVSCPLLSDHWAGLNAGGKPVYASLVEWLASEEEDSSKHFISSPCLVGGDCTPTCGTAA
eukprot:c25670_g1_i1.p1 GENE.c25670_g1_i1~~c25670_g1_i1.p1  ORF type:complete len:488 (+),score=83.61 c25670_g1_i1:54-1466(+)